MCVSYPWTRTQDVHLSPSRLQACFDLLVADLQLMYRECRLVHCDLSEYNVLYHDGSPWIIDVGQVWHVRSLCRRAV